jgi:hypothetical protein
MSTERKNPQSETYTPAQIIYRQAETIRRQAKSIDSLRSDMLAHLAIGAIIGGFVVSVCYWQADPLIRALDDLFTAAGWLGP